MRIITDDIVGLECYNYKLVVLNKVNTYEIYHIRKGEKTFPYYYDEYLSKNFEKLGLEYLTEWERFSVNNKENVEWLDFNRDRISRIWFYSVDCVYIKVEDIFCKEIIVDIHPAELAEWSMYNYINSKEYKYRENKELLDYLFTRETLRWTVKINKKHLIPI